MVTTNSGPLAGNINGYWNILMGSNGDDACAQKIRVYAGDDNLRWTGSDAIRYR
jgi:hypothetical protein